MIDKSALSVVKQIVEGSEEIILHIGTVMRTTVTLDRKLLEQAVDKDEIVKKSIASTKRKILEIIYNDILTELNRVAGSFHMINMEDMSGENAKRVKRSENFVRVLLKKINDILVEEEDIKYEAIQGESAGS